MQTDPGDGIDLGHVAVALLVALCLVGSIAGGAAVAGASSGSGNVGASTAATGTTAASTSTATGATPTMTPTSTSDATSLAQAVDTDRTRIRIGLQPTSDGRWTVEFWTRLEDDADEEAFAELEADVENDPANYTSGFRDRMSGSVDSASAATGREMAMENVTVSTRTEGVPSSYGVLAYEFTWTNFAAVDGDRLRAGAAIDAFLLETNTRLTIAWPAAYRATSIEPAPDDRTDTAAVWRGDETDFIAGEPRVVVTSAPPADDSILPVLGAIVAVLALLFVLAWLVHSGRLRRPAVLGGGAAGSPSDGAGEGATASDGTAAGSPAASRTDRSAGAGADAGESGTNDPDSTSPPDGTAAGSPSDGATDDSTSDGAPADSAGDDTAPGDGSADDAAGSTEDVATGGSATEELPAELLSNEEQVLRLLEAEGGRMKQQQVVSSLEWTDAKTSQVVTSMREDDQIEVFRIGRENVLALPGEMDL